MTSNTPTLGFTEDFGPRRKHRTRRPSLPEAASTPQTGDFLVSPATARKWLEQRNVNNYRRTSAQHIKSLAREMVDGRWLLTHQAVAFDKNGVLVDGQHRLEAIIRAGKAVPLAVRTNVDPRARDVVDVGKKRNTSTILHARGIRHAATVAAATRLCVMRDNNNNFVAMTPAELADMVTLYSHIEEDAVDAKSIYNVSDPARILRPGVMGMLLNAVRREKGTGARDALKNFLVRVAEGLNLDRGTPEVALRRRLIAVRDDRNVTLRVATEAALILSAFARSLSGSSRPVSKIQLKEEAQLNRLPYLDKR